MNTLMDCSCKRNKIQLEDYDFQRDLKQRLMMRNLSVQEVELLDEMLSGPSTIAAPYLLDQLEMTCPELQQCLQKLEPSGLFSIEKSMIHLNKELRAYFDYEIEKFSPTFKPDISYVRRFLKKIPIQNLPSWYQIPRTSDNIFDSILEATLITPPNYRRYLKELEFENPLIDQIIETILFADNFEVLTDDLLEKFSLSAEELSYILLHLEFNLVLCVSYKKVGDVWKERVTPIYEWQQYMKWKAERKPAYFPHEAVVPDRSSPYVFVQLMTTLLKTAAKKPLPFDQKLDPKEALEALSSLEGFYLEQDLQVAAQKLLQLNLAKVAEGKLVPHKHFNEWVSLSDEDQAILLYRHPLNKLLNPSLDPSLLDEKSLKEVEKSLSFYPENEWFDLEAFKKRALPNLSGTPPVLLKKKGRSWMYELPQFEDKHYLLMEEVILERLCLSGFVETGRSEEKRLLRLTPLGSRILRPDNRQTFYS